MNYYGKSLQLHEKGPGKLEVSCTVPLQTQEDLSLAYTPGVAEPCRKIAEHPQDAYRYTTKGNTIAVLTDGSAVLGLGNIGAAAAIPVMEGKAALFQTFSGINAIPICLTTQDPEEIVRIAEAISPTFGGINLEDISAPRCFQIEEELQRRLDIPVFHDDQHGTAIVAAAAVMNAMKVVKKSLESIRVVISGGGAAGTAIARMLLSIGAREIIVCDRCGILCRNQTDFPNESMRELAFLTNPGQLQGHLSDAMRGADVFIGVSAPRLVTKKMILSMNRDAVVFAMANPEPEILPKEAKEAGARVIGTGRSDYPNQINNLLAFPGVFRGALDARAKKITPEMKRAAAFAIAESLSVDQLSEEKIIPDIFDSTVTQNVSKAVAKAWVTSLHASEKEV